MQVIDASKSKERVFGQIMRIVSDVHAHNTSEKSQLREVIAFKFRQTLEMLNRAADDKIEEPASEVKSPKAGDDQSQTPSNKDLRKTSRNDDT